MDSFFYIVIYRRLLS